MPAKVTAVAAPATGVKVAQGVEVPDLALTASALIARAYEYGWNEDYDSERAYLEAAASSGTGDDAVRARILLAEVLVFHADKAAAQGLLQEAAATSSSQETQAFAALIGGLMQLEPRFQAHGRRYYSDSNRCQQLYATAADLGRGSFLGGWAALRQAGVYRSQLGQPENAVKVLEQVANTYAGTPFGEYAREEEGAVLAFGLGKFGTGRRIYERLLATTSDDFVRQRVTLHLGELLMDRQQYRDAHRLFTTFVTAWPAHARTVGAVMLRGYVAHRLNLWDEAVADAHDYLANTAASNPAYTGKAHLILGKEAAYRGDRALAEQEFSLVDDPYLAPEAKAQIARGREVAGDLRGAVAAYREAAASLTEDRRYAPRYLYEAAVLAERAGDTATHDAIVAQMVAEFPGNHFTTRLVGHEVLPIPDI